MSVSDDKIDYQSVEKLRKDLRQAESGLSREQARWFVDAYYQIQDFRIQAGGQARAASAESEPLELVGWLLTQFQTLEREIQNSLGRWARIAPVGRWAQSITGIGPVISAGLVAHIDIAKAPTAGHIWRFAGLDSTLEWEGVKAARELVTAAQEVEKTPASTVLWLAKATHRKVSSFWEAQGVNLPSRDEALAAVMDQAGCDKSEVEELFAERPLHVDNAIAYACEQLGIEDRDVYEWLYPSSDLKLDTTAIQKYLSKRPYNAKLKVLCWKIGDSFVKQSSRESDIYGHVYRERKELEVKRDAEGYNEPAAKETLEKRRINDAETRKIYESGRLPAGRLDLRARRYAVKLFLSHYQWVAYESTYNTKPPMPYIIQHGGHTDFIAPPNWPMTA